MRKMKLESMWPLQHLIIYKQCSDPAELSGSGFSLNLARDSLKSFLSAPPPWALEAGLS